MKTSTETEEAIIERMLASARDLISNHWDSIAEIRENDPERSVSVGLKFDVDCRGSSPRLKTKLSWAARFSDEIEENIEDPAQVPLPLEAPPVPPTKHRIEIDMDQKCEVCGKPGATQSGVCLKCVGKKLRAKMKQEAAAKRK